MAVIEAPFTSSAEAHAPKSLPFTRQYVDQWCATCTNFLQWERQYILKGEPSPEQRREHRETLKWLLRLTRLMHSMAADPDFPDPSAVDLLATKLWQLDQSWKMVYEPLNEEEAKRILTEVFPDEPRT